MCIIRRKNVLSKNFCKSLKFFVMNVNTSAGCFIFLLRQSNIACRSAVPVYLQMRRKDEPR